MWVVRDPAKELVPLRKKWRPPKPHYKEGILAEYAHRVSSASTGRFSSKPAAMRTRR